MEIGHALGSSQYLGLNFLATPGLHVTTFHNLATALKEYGSKGKRRDRNRCYEDETQSVFEIITQPMWSSSWNSTSWGGLLGNETRYLKGCFVRTFSLPRIAAAAPAAAPVQAPRWNLESLLPRGLWHAARIARGDMHMSHVMFMFM